MRIVVNLVGDRDHGYLAESRFVDRPYLPGGERSMYELAFAAAAIGLEVELRGWLHRSTFDMMAVCAGGRPQVQLEARPPRADDLVIVPEGWRDPLGYAHVALSPARIALFVLAAPGLFGWPFTERWEPPDPLIVPLEAVARPEHFAAAVALGFELLTNSLGIVRVANDAGVPCAFIGAGRPGWSPPAVVEKTVDVAAILDNRWAPLAEEVLGRLDGDITVDRIGQVPNDELITRLTRARVLVWPSRIEGQARISWEARSVGCVPIALESNRFAAGLGPEHGAVVVDSIDGIASGVEAMLADGARLNALADIGRRTAPQEVDWSRYVERVRAFVDAPAPPDPGRPARAGLGEVLRAQTRDNAASAQAKFEALDAQVEAARRDLDRLNEQLAGAIHHHDTATAERDLAIAELQGLRASRSVRAIERLRVVRERGAR